MGWLVTALVSRFELLWSLEGCYSYLQLFGIIINMQNWKPAVCCARVLVSRINLILSHYRSAFRVAVVVAGITLELSEGLSHVSHQYLFIKLNDCSKPRRLWYIYRSYAKTLCWPDERDVTTMGLLAARTSPSRIYLLVMCRPSVKTIISLHMTS